MTDTGTPTGGTVTPTGGTVTPTGGTVTPTSGTLTPTGGPSNIITAGDTGASSGGTVTPSGGTLTPTGGAAAIVWGDNWRKELAGGDEKKLAMLQRYQSPQAYIDGTFALRQRMDSGELKAQGGPPENATPEQLTAWRKENGIPDAPDGYLKDMPDGLVVGDPDKELFGSFAKRMHDINAPPSYVHAMAKWYYDTFGDLEAKQVETDRISETESEDGARAKWGPDYRSNVGMIKSLFEGELNGIADMIFSARTADGRSLMHHVPVLDFFASLARERISPIALPGGRGAGGDQLQSVQGRIAEIEKMQKTDGGRPYWSNPALQEELRGLYDARTMLEKRGKAT